MPREIDLATGGASGREINTVQMRALLAHAGEELSRLYARAIAGSRAVLDAEQGASMREERARLRERDMIASAGARFEELERQHEHLRKVGLRNSGPLIGPHCTTECV